MKIWSARISSGASKPAAPPAATTPLEELFVPNIRKELDDCLCSTGGGLRLRVILSN